MWAISSYSELGSNDSPAVYLVCIFEQVPSVYLTGCITVVNICEILTVLYIHVL